jgi:hypothetical protein
MALSYILTGPNGGRVGKKAGPFYLIPSEVTTDTINFELLSDTGTFTPPALSINNSGDRVPFYFTPASVGPAGILLTSALGATISGSRAFSRSRRPAAPRA